MRLCPIIEIGEPFEMKEMEGTLKKEIEREIKREKWRKRER